MKDIPGFPHYQITEDGKIWSKYKNRFIKETDVNSWGYKSYTLRLNCKSYGIPTHKLLALTYIPNPKNLPIADHIDRNKTNNILSNLRWVNKSQNGINAEVKGKIKFRHITTCNRKIGPYYYIQIRRNQKRIYHKKMSIKKYTIDEVVKYRNEVVYPQFNIEIDD